MRNEIIIENASLKEFLMELVKNLGRREVTTASYISKKYFRLWRYFLILIYQENLEKMLNTIMILEVKKEKNFMIYF